MARSDVQQFYGYQLFVFFYNQPSVTKGFGKSYLIENPTDREANCTIVALPLNINKINQRESISQKLMKGF
jgi:hypothetical protein